MTTYLHLAWRGLEKGHGTDQTALQEQNTQAVFT